MNKTEQRKQKAAAEFYKLAEERGWRTEGEYINAQLKIKMICPNGHEQMKIPNGFKRGKGCRVCSGNDPKTAKREFCKIAKQAGGFLLFGNKGQKFTWSDDRIELFPNIIIKRLHFRQ